MFLSTAAFAGTKACTSAMVTADICRAEANVLLFFDAPASFWLSLAAEICEGQGYQEEIDGAPNPQTCGQFAQQWIRGVFIKLERNGRAQTAAEAARDVVQSEPDADVGDGD